ncbi:L,D-transpeptidase family protein [Campylobacter pinnipediorum]|uniref:L,D-TPase catalytic domain-containing protein n=1 Tax=Campylobacter pinnipediorum subsp. pinnipediorum TaxID=1660067 RepID=A0AAX0L947_9BACT|nr:L,D-transpeptidase family protein [Campylobacter pinnipediorum]AQW80861.1 peptidoglycan LD-carboxypeptidase [Campylobacter pinnipediorum subsp. pinnipediorum]AQW82480.1 peptidoglycan LD-carboxypeptidase [Campylobacter pinnipediorum subsp. pinnipediorum]AQW84150.1 peptidoglycan LD-carboxypeptidase [Campylobacter pinnipediorum subsp. pinnipediorum]OPA74521.1 hypothetical protein BFG05_07265 [Campylobacter pinnipediorum subsp. pinnipediorum]OPA74859.1 hypothetical protein BFG04_06580 [Campylob
MPRILFALFVFAIICLNAVDYEDMYLKKGSNEVIKTIEKNILSKDFWTKRLEGIQLDFGYYDEEALLTVVSKEKKYLEVYKYSNGKLEKTFNTNILVGKLGNKLVEGDLKTPVGVYQLTRRFTPLDSYLGPLAFSLSYPNLHDKLSNKTGSGIWIHGFPINGSREDEINTKGCVVMENNILMQYDKIIDYKKSLAIIYENDIKKATTDQIATIFSQIFAWKKAWTESDIDSYLNFYDKNFKRYDGMSFEKFASFKKSIFSRKELKNIVFSKFIISPYPNFKNETMFRVVFYENYSTSNYKFNGEKTLYIKLVDDKIKILVED